MGPGAVPWEEEGGWDGSVPAALRAADMYLHPTKKPRSFQEPGGSTHLPVLKRA